MAQSAGRWRVDGGLAFNDEAGIRVTHKGRDTLRYEEKQRHLDLTIESNYPGASIYTSETHTWTPTGEPFTPEERAVVETQLRAALRAQGYSQIDFGRDR